MRRLATGSLLAALLVRVGAAWLAPSVWAEYLRAFCEAAVIGGLADWFAVTALFRHPLGLPIPHTRVLPRSKERIGRSLSLFVIENFLNAEVVSRRLEHVDFSAKGADFLEARAEALSALAAEHLPRVFSALDDEQMGRFLETQLRERLRAVPVGPVAARLLELLIVGDERVVDDMLKLGGEALLDNRDVLAGLIRKEIRIPDTLSVPGLPIEVPLGQVKDRVAALVAEEAVKRVLKTFEEVRLDPAHELRARVHERVLRLALELRESPEMLARGEEIKERFLAHPDASAYARGLWLELKAALLADAARPGGELRALFSQALRRASSQVRDDAPLRSQFNALARSAALGVVTGNAAALGKMVEDTVAGWDGDELSRKLQSQVGEDLQFVRLNGTLVGGLLGLALHGLASLL